MFAEWLKKDSRAYQVSVTEVMEHNEAEMFTDHCIASFEFASAVKAPPKLQRFVYDYARADLDGLRSSLQAVNLSNAISTGTAEKAGKTSS